jgi:RecA/RadA recombinase
LFSGGVPIGRIHNAFGMESQGKSTLWTYIAGQFQKYMPEEQQTVLYLDFERSFDAPFAEQLGLLTDSDHFIYTTPNNLEEAADMCAEFVPTKSLAAIILDSDAAAPTRTMMNDEAGKANFGGSAKGLGEFLRKMNILDANYDTTMFVISQVRANMNAFSHADAVTGGYASKFYPTTRNKVAKLGSIEEKGETIGIHMRIRNFKNKGGIPFRDALCDLYFGNGSNGIKGFDTDGEYFEFFTKLFMLGKNHHEVPLPNGEIQKVKSKADALSFIKDHQDVYKMLRDKVDAAMEKHMDFDNSEDPEGTEGDDDAAALAEAAIENEEMEMMEDED